MNTKDIKNIKNINIADEHIAAALRFTCIACIDGMINSIIKSTLKSHIQRIKDTERSRSVLNFNLLHPSIHSVSRELAFRSRLIIH
jgi:hypothetical protein